jgi:hypothetical protein
MHRQPWIGRPLQDIVFILLPPFLCLAVVALFPHLFQNNKDMPDAGWVILVLLVDVAHVYSTLYRTYFDPQALSRQRSLLWTIPFFSFVGGVLLYSISSLLFWRLLAYVAVFHFVRQQYGFMRVYSRREEKNTWPARIDTLTIYTATLYPILYWHLHGPRNFNWFVDGDFVFPGGKALLPVATTLYWMVVIVYLTKEVMLWAKTKTLNLPKAGIISGTLLSWYFGIVYFNGDMAFTLLNVVSHGIPYMALIWVYGQKTYARKERGYTFLKLVFSRYGVLLFLGLIFLFAFVEEGLWDLTLWKEHKNIFGMARLLNIELSSSVLSFLVPLLALPQMTHYILDGFIWKVRKDEFKWSSEVKAGRKFP